MVVVCCVESIKKLMGWQPEAESTSVFVDLLPFPLFILPAPAACRGMLLAVCVSSP